MQYKIIVDKQSSTNPSEERREYIIDIEELRVKGNVHDSLIITKGEDYVMRRLHLSEYHVLTELEEPVKEPLEGVNIELFEGDNYIYLMDMTGNKFYAEYLVKNDFTDLYVTKNEMTSAINQSAGEIEISVNQKLTEYATTAEMNASINAKAGEINLEVAKKVNDKDLTGANIILRINNDKSESFIMADKIEISANDILNLLAGNTINLTSKNIAIASNNFNVDKNGNMTCKNANVTGTINSSNATITGGKVKVSGGNSATDLIRVENNSDESIFSYIQPRGAGFVYGGSNNAVYIWAGDTSSVEVVDNNGTSEIRGSEVRTPKVTQTSLESHKKNFEKLENAIDIIKAIDIYKYNLKFEDDRTKKHIGFVIGDKYRYSKDVTSDDDKGVDIYSFASVCCKAIQEQQETIENQAKEIDNLKERLARLEEIINERQ